MSLLEQQMLEIPMRKKIYWKKKNKTGPSLRQVVEESHRIAKARKRLVARLHAIDSQITPISLQMARETILRDFDRRSSFAREQIRNKEMSLFDENKNSAPASDAIKKILFQLMKQPSSV